MVYDSLQVIIQEKQSKQVHLWEIWHDEGYKIGKRGPSQQLLSVCLSVKSSIAQVLASWFRKDARRGICDCPSCSDLDVKRNGQPSSRPSFLEVLACPYFLLWVACVLLRLPLSRCLCWSLPPWTSGWYTCTCIFTCKLVAVADHTISFDRLLPQDFSLRTIDKIAFGIPHEVSFKSLGTHLLGSHLQYSRLCYIRSVLLDLYYLCIG